MSARRDSLTWVLLILVFAGIAGWNLWQSWRYRGEVARLEREVGRSHAAEAETAERYGESQAAAVALTGRRLAWPAGLEQIAAAPDAASHVAAHRLVMYFSELSCNTCREREAQFVSGLATATGGAGVALVVHASNPRYVRNFLRLNNLAQMTVYFDREASFESANGIGETPVLLLLDADGRVVVAHVPLPGRPQWSEPFHRRASELLGLM